MPVGLGRGVVVVVAQGQLAQHHLPAYGQRRETHGLFQHALGALAFAQGYQHLGQAVVQAGHHREGLERLLVNALGLGQLVALVQQAAEGCKGPGRGAAGDDGGEKLLQLIEAVEVAQGIGAVAQAQRGEARVLLAQLGAGRQHFGRAAAVQGLEDRLEQGFALHQFFQALGQADAVERLGQVGVGLVLQRAEDDRLAAFGSDHEEHALMADQLVEDQVLEHLLAVLLAIAQVEVLEDKVVALLRAHAQRLLTAVGRVDIAYAQLAQHGTGRAAKIREIIDDQKAFLAVDLHPRDLSWQIKKWTQRHLHGQARLRG
ncbi:hypothetical protein D3C77_206020 [compost metagenome]